MGEILDIRLGQTLCTTNLSDEMSSPVSWIRALGVSDVILVHILPAIVVPFPVPSHLTVAYQGIA